MRPSSKPFLRMHVFVKHVRAFRPVFLVKSVHVGNTPFVHGGALAREDALFRRLRA